MFFKNKSTGVSWLVVGLGNLGDKYEHTRHNVGFDVVDTLADQLDIPVQRLKYKALTNTAELGGEKVLLMKPTTFMNLSGHSIGEAAKFFKIPADHVLVLCDDITQDPGKLRIRDKGSAGGHNGLKDIIAALGSQEFPRIRIGVGAKPNPEYDLAAWVLGRFSGEEKKALEGRFDDVEAAAKLIMGGQLGLAQSRYNH